MTLAHQQRLTGGRKQRRVSNGFERTLRELSMARMRYDDLRRQGASLTDRVRSLDDLHDLRARMAAYFHYV